MPYESKIVAGVEITPLCDAVGPMGTRISKPLPEMFPGGSFADDAEWVLHFHCYLLRAEGRTVLVDTGVGGTDSPAAEWAPVPGHLLTELADVGVGPDDVDVVVLTHLHSDHASGCVEAGVPVFPNARHVIQQAELDWVTGPMRQDVVEPLRDSIQVVNGDEGLLPGIRIVHAPGHTPGHQCVEVGDHILTGDALHHPVQLADPTITYVYDEDPEQAVVSRLALLRRAAVIAPGHFSQAFVPVRSTYPVRSI
ncbi:MBL fold metallo-hydrolase [Planotetraspora mira]|uniref:MBL fold metallo-hydrolase n=1 Tax=Planotetraspora mira TaxID=58121 RepID=A0A8J3TM43_9ACTN|nr:MBL fold metallo-hydrolase [Planotetraspora mira]GII28316.1 MBL fold metallo-hydrolase [Planotetraspora mira]